MKTYIWTSLFLVMTFSSCKEDSVVVKGFYDSIHFERVGGGDSDFNLYPTENSDKINVIVNRYNGIDAPIQFVIDNSVDIASAFSSFHNAINSQTQINGNFKQTSVPTGTWLFIYVIKDSKETEVTNTELRDCLMKFERIVIDHFQQGITK